MKFYIYVHGKEAGPYLPEEITGLFGGVSPDTLICTEFEYKNGTADWRQIRLLPELANCIKYEIAEPLVKYNPDSARGITLKILSTDDDSNIRELLWHMLTDAGHTMEFAKDGEEVFKRLAVKTYDLVILDVNMPKMNGYKVSELLHKKLRNPPMVIIFTGRDLEKERLQFVCSGADAILSKGTSNDKLIQTIEGLFSKRPEKTVKKEEMFIPEPPPPGSKPPPPVIKEFPAANEPTKLQKEEFYSSADQEKTVPLTKAAPQPMTGKALPAVRSPVSDRENSGKPDTVFNQLILENRALKSDLADIRRLLGHVELWCAQLEKQFEKQTLTILNKNQETAQKLEAAWQNLRNYVTLTILLLLVAVLAAALLS